MFQERPGARHDEHADRRADDRIGQRPAGEHDDQRRSDDADRAEHVGQHLEIGALEVEAFLRSGGQQPHADQVHHQPHHRDDQHRRREHFGRREDALVRLVEDVDRKQQQHDRIDQRCQYLGAQIAEGLGGRRRAGCKPDGEQRQREAAGIGEHVRGIGQQRQAARNPRADHLDDEEGGGERQRPDEALAMPRPRRPGGWLLDTVAVTGAHVTLPEQRTPATTSSN